MLSRIISRDSQGRLCLFFHEAYSHQCHVYGSHLLPENQSRSQRSTKSRCFVFRAISSFFWQRISIFSLIDIMHSIGRYDIVNCNGLSCFCELRLIDFREISSGLLRDIYFSFLTTEIIQQYNLSSLLEIKSLAIFEAVITYHSKVKQCTDSLHPSGSIGNRTYPRMFLLQCKVGFALNVDPIISR